MSEHPKIWLSRLRDIGWRYWDPIGLLDEGDSWQGKPFADEYDSYLLGAALMVRTKEPVIAVIEYLVSIEANDMGLGLSSDARRRARIVVDAIRADEELWRRTSVDQ